MFSSLKKISFWNWLAILGPIVTIVAAVPAIQNWFSEKSISFVTVAEIPFFDENSYFKEFKLSYGDISIKEGGIIVFSIKNNGEKPIKASDFDGPIEVKFHEKTKVLATEIENAWPENLKINYEIKNNIIRFFPLLLNSKDHFFVKVILSGKDLKITPNLRIAGIDNIEKINYKIEKERKLKIVLITMFVLSVLIYSIIYFLFVFNVVLKNRYKFYIPKIASFLTLVISMSLFPCFFYFYKSTVYSKNYSKFEIIIFATLISVICMIVGRFFIRGQRINHKTNRMRAGKTPPFND